MPGGLIGAELDLLSATKVSLVRKKLQLMYDLLLHVQHGVRLTCGHDMFSWPTAMAGSWMQLGTC